MGVGEDADAFLRDLCIYSSFSLSFSLYIGEIIDIS